MNEYEAHLSSYDHSHKQRLKDMRVLTRDPLASTKARKAEAKANSQSGLISIKLGGETGTSSGSGGGFKKAGFKKVGFKSAFKPAEGEEEVKVDEAKQVGGHLKAENLNEGSRMNPQYPPAESDTEEEGEEMYDPRKPTD